jgi:hypothetical protein
LDSVQAGDLSAVARAIAALRDARSAGAAAGAIRRLGDAVLPSMAELLDAAGSPAPLLALRLVRAATTRSTARDEVLLPHVGHRDRELGLAVTERLIAPEPAPEAAVTVLDGVMPEDLRHAARILAAQAAIDGADDPRETDAPLRRALADELDLVCRRVQAGRVARHGSARLGPVMVELHAGGPRGALALEALDVLLGPAESRLVLPLLNPDLAVSARLAQLPPPVGDTPTNLLDWIRDLVEDADGAWDSTWLRACALHAAKARGMLDRLDLAAARALGDPIIDEILGSR